LLLLQNVAAFQQRNERNEIKLPSASASLQNDFIYKCTSSFCVYLKTISAARIIKQKHDMSVFLVLERTSGNKNGKNHSRVEKYSTYKM